MDRVSEGHSIVHDLRFKQFTPESESIQLPQLTKKTKGGQNVKTSLPFMPVSLPLCCAMFESESLSVGRWIKDILARVGTDTRIFKAHSVKGH